MGPINAEVAIDRTREDIFAVLSDLSRRPTFTDHFLTGFHLTRIDPVGIGAGARFRAKAPLRSVWMDTVIVEQDEPMKIVERGLGGRTNRIVNNTVWEITGATGRMTKVTLTYWTEPAALDRGLELLSAGSVWQQRGWREALRRLRDGLESEHPDLDRIAVAGGNRYATGIP